MAANASNKLPARGSELQQEQLEHVARRNLAQLGLARLLTMLSFLIIATMIARFSWDLPLLRVAESALYDLRVAVFAPQADQDQRIVTVVYDDATLTSTMQRSPLDRTILAQALQRLDGLGAKGIAIDILFDSPQADDALLIKTLRAMQKPTFVGYATHQTNGAEITYEQTQFLQGFVAQLEGSRTKPASIRLEADSDGVARRWPDQPASLPPFLALAVTGNQPGDARPAFADFRGPILYRAPAASDRPVFQSFTIDTIIMPEMAELLGPQIAGKYVLIGGNIVGVDQFETPFSTIGGDISLAAAEAATADGAVPTPSRGDVTMIGLNVHGHMLAQLLDNKRPAPLPGWVLWSVAALIVLAGALSAMVQGRAMVIGAIILAQLLFIFGLPFLLEKANINTLDLPSVGWGIGWSLAYGAVGAAMRVIGAKQREFAQGALGKYLPASVATEIMRNPERLLLHGEKREIFCVFTDLEGFTKLSHSIEPEMVAQLLNDYLDRLSAVVLRYGGTLDKFVGDAVVAFWGAPLSYPDDGERAVRAGWAMFQAGEDFRRNAPPGLPPIGATRVGVHFGEAIVGNFGGEGRIQYTALGDSMNTASRLESANKALGTRMLVSREAMERSGIADWFRPMGKVVVRGRSTAVEIFEPMPYATEEQRAYPAELIAAFAEQDADAPPVQRLTDKLQLWGEDAALSNLLARLRNTPKGEGYVLG